MAMRDKAAAAALKAVSDSWTEENGYGNPSDIVQTVLNAHQDAMVLIKISALRKLALGSVTVDHRGIVRRLDSRQMGGCGGVWLRFDHEHPEDDRDLMRPVTVIYEPKA